MTTSTFASQLKHWRAARGLSQFDLALLAETTPRIVSAIETGRSTPSSALVQHLGEVLEVPLRERNLMLASAGHAPAFHETPLDELGPLTTAVDHIVAAQEPNMALVLDRQWNLVKSNPAGARFMFAMFPEPPAWIAPPLNHLRLSLHPDGLRRHILNWEASAAALLRRLQRDVASRPNDEELEALLLEVLDYPDVADLQGARTPSPSEQRLVPTIYRIAGREIRLFTTTTTISDPHDLTLEELRIETFWPADRESADHWTTVTRPPRTDPSDTA